MNYLLEVCLVATLATGITPSLLAQSQAIPAPALQKGISVKLPATGNSLTMPDADREDALIVSVTSDGSVYVSVNRVSPAALAEAVSHALPKRAERKVYVKADARASYANVLAVIDAVRSSGVEELSLLTAQQESPKPGALMPPKGIQVWLARDCPQARR